MIMVDQEFHGLKLSNGPQEVLLLKALALLNPIPEIKGFSANSALPHVEKFLYNFILSQVLLKSIIILYYYILTASWGLVCTIYS